MEPVKLNIRLWLEKNGFPQGIYIKLHPIYKDLLRKLICPPFGLTTAKERRDLYRKLCSLTGVAGRDSIYPAGNMTDEDIEKFFSPLTPSDWHKYLSKF